MHTALRDRLTQAHREGLGRAEAVAFSSRLLSELENYLQRRRRRGYHTSHDDLFETLLPGLALAIHLLSEQGTDIPILEEEVREQWGTMFPDTVQLLAELVATFGLEYTQRVVAALEKEARRAQASERTELVLFIMEWGIAQQHPRIRADEVDLQAGLDAWSAFCGNAPIEELRAIREKILVLQRAAQGRLKLAKLSQHPLNET